MPRMMIVMMMMDELMPCRPALSSLCTLGMD